ncbi:MAG: ROK family protein [Spirochaetales bacterium]|nr:ROK family protein [Spirochaetales bacterium]
MAWLLGLDIGGTKSAAVLGEQQTPGRLESVRRVDRVEFASEPRRGLEDMLARLFESAGQLLERNGLAARDLARAGVSCGGPLDSSAGVVLSPPNLPGWDGVPIVQLVRERLGVAACLANDADASALAEWLFGAGRGFRDLVFLTFGTGMGAGLILNGRLYSGAGGMAGEVGHIRLAENGPVGYGKAGSFEGFCSGGGLAELARIKVLERLQRGEAVSFCPDHAGLESLNARSVAEAARAGDPVAREIFALCGTYLGRGLAVLIDALNPQRIILGGIFPRARELLWPAAERALDQEALPRSRKACSIVPAELGEQIGDYACLAVAAYEPEP